MAKDRNVRETRPRDEDFEIDSSYSPYETEKKKDYRERPGIVLAILYGFFGKKVHPIVFIALGAAAGIAFHLIVQ